MPKKLKTIRWSVELAASEFQVDRRTLCKRIRAGGIQPGSDGKLSTEQICAAVFGDYRREQLREMRARATKLELENECMRAKVMPCEDYRTAFGYYLAIFRTFCVGHIGKTLLQSDVDEAHKSLNDFLISQLPESEQPAARAAFEKTQIDAMARRIEGIRDTVERDEHKVEQDRLCAVVRAAYAAAVANPTRENLDGLEAGWRAYDAHWKKSRAYAYSIEHQPGSLESDEKAEKRYAEQRANIIQRSRTDRGNGQFPGLS